MLDNLSYTNIAYFVMRKAINAYLEIMCMTSRLRAFRRRSSVRSADKEDRNRSKKLVGPSITLGTGNINHFGI